MTVNAIPMAKQTKEEVVENDLGKTLKSSKITSEIDFLKGMKLKQHIAKEAGDGTTLKTIADFQSAEYMIREMIKMIGMKKTLFPPALRMVICIPSGITEVEERAVKDSAEQAGAKEIRLIHEPMAAAIGIGIDVLEPTGNMIIDIGGGTSEIAVIALGGIVNNTSIRIAGDDFNADIEEYMRKQHNITIGERTAERIKIEVGAAITELDNPPDDYAVHGRDMLTGIPKEVTVNYKEIASCLDKSISKIEAAVLNALEKTPPELSADIFRTGIYLAGGGSMLRGLDKRLHHKTKLSVHVAEDPLRAVARGTGIALKNSVFLIPSRFAISKLTPNLEWSKFV